MQQGDRQSKDGRGSKNAPAKSLIWADIQESRTIMLGPNYFDPGIIERLSGSWGGFGSKAKFQSNALIHELWHVYFNKDEGGLLKFLRENKADIPANRGLSASEAIVKWQQGGCQKTK